MEASEKKHFNAIADIFDSRFNRFAAFTRRLRTQRRKELFLSHARPGNGAKILEIGCGTGACTKELLSAEWSLFAVDISERMLANALKKTACPHNLHVFVADVEHLSVKDEVFDAVMGNSVLHHLAVKDALAQIARVLKKGGRCVFSEPNMLNPHIFLQKNIPFLKRLSGDSPEETAFFRWCIKRLFEQSGFTQVNVRPFDFVHPFTPGIFVNTLAGLGLALEKTPLLKEIAGSLIITGVKE